MGGGGVTRNNTKSSYQPSKEEQRTPYLFIGNIWKSSRCYQSADDVHITLGASQVKRRDVLGRGGVTRVSNQLKMEFLSNVWCLAVSSKSKKKNVSRIAQWCFISPKPKIVLYEKKPLPLSHIPHWRLWRWRWRLSRSEDIQWQCGRFHWQCAVVSSLEPNSVTDVGKLYSFHWATEGRN